ncbi:MAG: DUF3047 domain-containing protein [Nitrospirae bacterium]|nr:DUF3047 domain-containing protein [Nitrospirota bacterium]
MRFDRLIYFSALLLAVLLILGMLRAEFSTAGPSSLIVDPAGGGLGANGLPVGWDLKQWFGGGRDIRIENNDGKPVLHLISKQNSFGLYKKLDFDIHDYPYLTWRWRATVLPNGGDVRNKTTDDQAAQVYVLFPRFPSAVNTRLVGYIWENLTPKNLHVTSTKSSNTRYIVLRDGTDPLGSWVQERRNVLEDYRELFGEEPPQVGGVTLMIDSDDTQSTAESYFDILRFQKE